MLPRLFPAISGVFRVTQWDIQGKNGGLDSQIMPDMNGRYHIPPVNWAYNEEIVGLTLETSVSTHGSPAKRPVVQPAKVKVRTVLTPAPSYFKTLSASDVPEVPSLLGRTPSRLLAEIPAAAGKKERLKSLFCQPQHLSIPTHPAATRSPEASPQKSSKIIQNHQPPAPSPQLHPSHPPNLQVIQVT